LTYTFDWDVIVSWWRAIRGRQKAIKEHRDVD